MSFQFVFGKERKKAGSDKVCVKLLHSLFLGEKKKKKKDKNTLPSPTHSFLFFLFFCVTKTNVG